MPPSPRTVSTPAASPGPDTPARVSAGDGAGGVRSARRALEIVSLLDESHPVLTTREVVERTELPRTTVLRLLDTLEQTGLLWAIASNHYVAGPSLLRWATLAQRAWQLPARTREAMCKLAEDTGETASIYVRQDVHRICIAAAEGNQALRHVARVGSQQPLWAGAPARILLIGAPATLLKRVAALSPAGPAQLATLTRTRDDAARDGFAVTHSDREDGLSVVAVPVYTPAGAVIASVSLAGPSPRFRDERIPGFCEGLRTVATLVQEARFENGPGVASPD